MLGKLHVGRHLAVGQRPAEGSLGESLDQVGKSGRGRRLRLGSEITISKQQRTNIVVAAVTMDPFHHHLMNGHACDVLWTALAGADLAAGKAGLLERCVGRPNLQHVTSGQPGFKGPLGGLCSRFEGGGPLQQRGAGDAESAADRAPDTVGLRHVECRCPDGKAIPAWLLCPRGGQAAVVDDAAVPGDRLAVDQFRFAAAAAWVLATELLGNEDPRPFVGRA